MVSNNLENYCLDKTKCSRGDWVGTDHLSRRVSVLMCPWVLTLALPEWEKRCVHVLGSVMRDKINRIPDRPAVVHEQAFVLWVRFTDCDSGTDAFFF